MKQVAKLVYSFDYDTVIDRTQEYHPVGKFDIDFRKRNARNPKARRWVYGGSARTFEKAKNDAEVLHGNFDCEVRIVDAKMGEIIQVGV